MIFLLYLKLISKKLFNKNKLYLIGDRFGCKELKFEKRELNENDCLAFFLIDKGVQSYGMQIASIFQKFINNQNTFLRNIFDNILPENHKLNLLKNKIIKNPIDIQKANKCNLISLNIKTENYQSFNELLLLYSYKESFDKDNHLTFEKSNKIYYNFEQIEEELENLLLPEKKLFTDKIYPVIYQYEGFRGEENSSILPSFIASNPQKDLNDTQKKILYKFKLEQYSREIRKKILFSIQLIITFYLDKPYGETLIKDTLNDLPNYFVIPTITKDLLINNDFKVNEILSIFEYFELLCFEEFKNNLDLGYKKELTKEQIENINLYYIYENQNKSKNEINENHKQIKFKIPKIELCSTLRKVMSRSLTGLREDYEIQPEANLFEFLEYKEDIWSPKIFKNVSFSEEIEQIKKFNILASQILNLYEILGGDEDLLGEEIQKMKNIEENIGKEEKEIKEVKVKDKDKDQSKTKQTNKKVIVKKKKIF